MIISEIITFSKASSAVRRGGLEREKGAVRCGGCWIWARVVDLVVDPGLQGITDTWKVHTSFSGEMDELQMRGSSVVKSRKGKRGKAKHQKGRTVDDGRDCSSPNHQAL